MPSNTDHREALLEALRSDPTDDLCWLALADHLEEEGQTDPAELLRLHRQIRTMREGPKRREIEVRIQAALASGVRPVVPQFVNSVGMRLTLIPPGKYKRGSPENEPRRMGDEPLAIVRITRPFWMGVFLVTQAEFAAVTRRRPSHFKANAVEGRPDTSAFPVETVSWNDATAFCDHLSARQAEKKAGRSYRLPTEAEWEYACRGWISSRYPFHFGSTLSQGQANFDCRYPYPPAHDAPVSDRPGLGRVCEVGQYAPNAFGLFDMHGNLDEWCHDWFEGETYYREGPAADPPGPSDGAGKVIRGGSWRGQGEDARAAVRIGYDPTETYWHVGFRVVCDHRTS